MSEITGRSLSFAAPVLCALCGERGCRWSADHTAWFCPTHWQREVEDAPSLRALLLRSTEGTT